MNRAMAYASPIVVLACVACGAGTAAKAPEVATPPSATLAPPPPPPTAAQPAASATASAEPTPPAETPKKAPKGPLTVYDDPSGPTTVGYTGAVFRINTGAELRIPANAFSESRNIVFSLDPKAKAGHGKQGSVYLVRVQVPEREYVVGEESSSQPEPTRSDPFVLKLPLAQGQNSANLAIETIGLDPKSKKPKSTWTVYPMSEMESATPANRAVFKLNSLPDGHVHLTTDAPSQAPAQ